MASGKRAASRSAMTLTASNSAIEGSSAVNRWPASRQGRRRNSGCEFYNYTKLSNLIFAIALVRDDPFCTMVELFLVRAAVCFASYQPVHRNVGVPSMVLLVSDFRPDSCVVADVKASPNHGERARGSKIDMLVLHYTGMRDSRQALDYLCSPASEVSAHYVVMEDGHIVQCVPESRRAWHAGVSSWAGETDINSCSIGIEIANPGHEYGYPDFPRRQIAAVIALCRSIFIRHQIPADRVLAHSDVAPARKKDPGEKFPWRLLHDSGIGLWVKPAPLTMSSGRIFVLGDRDPEVKTLQLSLRSLGYGIETSGSYDSETMTVIAAFQRHYRPAKVDGIADVSTVATLQALLTAREPRASNWLKHKRP